MKEIRVYDESYNTLRRLALEYTEGEEPNSIDIANVVEDILINALVDDQRR